MKSKHKNVKSLDIQFNKEIISPKNTLKFKWEFLKAYVHDKKE